MYLGHKKPYRKPVSHRDEIDLLLHFPFGGLIGGELLPHAETFEASHKTSGNVKPDRKKRNLRYHW